jgi:hypothetical protein
MNHRVATLVEKHEWDQLSQLLQTIHPTRVDQLSIFFLSVFETSVVLEQDKKVARYVFDDVVEALLVSDGKPVKLLPGVYVIRLLPPVNVCKELESLSPASLSSLV